MYILLILFFVSLLGITFMIGRKFFLIQNGIILSQTENTPIAPHFFDEWKQSAVKNFKKYGYAGLVGSIRIYFRVNNVFKNKYEELKLKIKNTYNKKRNTENEIKREANKFLKMVSEYKNKVRKIKERVKEEEEENL